MTHSTSYSDNWEFADWKSPPAPLNKGGFRLQKRIFKAITEGDRAKAKSLQKLVLSSYAARMLATGYASPTCFARRIAQSDWQVSQLNTGKKTAGIDGKKSLTFKERFQLEKTLKQNIKTWKHQGLREIPIPKKDGLKAYLKSPNNSR